MNPIGPRERDILRRIQDLSLEVAEEKKRIQKYLEEQGFHPAEAWEMAGQFEEATLGKALQDGARLLPVAELADRFMEEVRGRN